MMQNAVHNSLCLLCAKLGCAMQVARIRIKSHCMRFRERNWVSDARDFVYLVFKFRVLHLSFRHCILRAAYIMPEAHQLVIKKHTEDCGKRKRQNHDEYHDIHRG